MEGFSPNLSKWAIASLFLSLLWSCQPEQKEEVQASAAEEILAPEEASGKFPYRKLSHRAPDDLYGYGLAERRVRCR